MNLLQSRENVWLISDLIAYTNEADLNETSYIFRNILVSIVNTYVRFWYVVVSLVGHARY